MSLPFDVPTSDFAFGAELVCRGVWLGQDQRFSLNRMSARLAATPFLCTAIAAVSERHAATGIVGHISAGLKSKSAAV